MSADIHDSLDLCCGPRILERAIGEEYEAKSISGDRGRSKSGMMMIKETASRLMTRGSRTLSFKRDQNYWASMRGSCYVDWLLFL